jgi:hypothetical protein
MAITQPNSYDNSTSLKKGIVDELSLIRTVVTPIWDVAKQEPVSTTTHYWNYVKLSAPTSSNAKSEGATLTAGTPSTETQFTQYTEVNARTFRVNSSMESMAKNGGLVGRTSEEVRLEKEARELLKTDCEWSFLNGAGAAGDTTPTARTMKGLITIAASGVTATAASATFSGTAGESAMEAHLIAVRAQGGLMGQKRLIYCSHTVKSAIRKWTGIATAVQTFAPDQKIYANVKIWESLFGPIQIEGHDLMPDTKVVTLDPNELVIEVLTPTRKDQNAVGALFTEYAVHNEMSIRYQPVASLGVVTLS